MREITYRISHKQGDFLGTNVPEVLYSGGIRAGKTVAFCLKAVMRAMHPAAREVLCRLTLERFRTTTLRTLLQGEGEFPPILPPGTYIHNVSQKWIRIKGGGLIEYFGLDERAGAGRTRMKIGGLGISGGGIDQVEECTEEQYVRFLSRMSARVTGLTPQLYCTANPSIPSNFLVKRFGIDCLAPENTPTTARTKFIHTTPFDNPHLSPEYRAIIAGMTGVEKRRLVDGLWVGAENTVYPGWQRQRHAVARREEGRLFVFIDDGQTNAAAILRAMVDGDDRVHVLREVQRAGMLTEEKIRVLRTMRPFEAIIIDPAASQLKAELRSAGFAVIDGNNDVLGGIAHVAHMLGDGPDGRPRLTVDPSCRTLIEQMESYRWETKGRERPIKEHDHGPDALRYGCAHFRSAPPLVFTSESLAVREASVRPPTAVGDFSCGMDERTRRLTVRSGRLLPVEFRRRQGGAWNLWGGGREDRRGPFVIFLVGGEGNQPTILAAADVRARELVAECCMSAKPEDAAGQAAMLRAYLTVRRVEPAVGLLGTPAGMTLNRACIEAGLSPEVWEPSAKEFAERVGLLRADVESAAWVEQAPRFFADARMYVWANGGVQHFETLESARSRASHADRVMSRAGLTRMLDRTPLPAAMLEPERLPMPAHMAEKPAGW